MCVYNGERSENMNVESDKRTYMKKIIFVMMMLAGVASGAKASDRGKTSTREVISLVRNYDHHEGFEIVSVGKLGIGLARIIANANADEDEKAALGILKDINKVVVVSYDEADQTKRQAFNSGMGKIMDKAEKILEVKEEGETVNIYGTSVNGGESIDDLMIFIPEDCTLVCILGSISAERIADLIEKANE